ncbi:MAG: pantetheine-phosphate adenylyltransferase [Planctomycetes bacterium]|nr:pantetheine-phosphate adenylyltransferase [Planctomycetota bacterium]
MVRALYPGSFDPVTNGHIDLVQRGLALFETVTVAVAANIGKQALLPIEDRLQLLRTVLPRTERVQVTTFRGLVVDFCKQNGYGVILRGLRTIADFEYEYQMALTNRHMRPDVETVFVMPSVQYSYVSSSLIKDVVRNGGDVSAFLPAPVEKVLRARLQASP